MYDHHTTRTVPDTGSVNIMFIGGGSRYPAFIGALKAVEELRIPVGRVIGASSGSAVAALYAAGLSPDEIHRLSLETDIGAFRDFSARGAMAGMGVCRGDALEQWLDEKLDGKRLGDGFRFPLGIVATDILNHTAQMLSGENYPDLKVSAAVRFSMGIPLVFAWKKFSHRGRDHVFIDGSLMAGIIENQISDTGRTLTIKTFAKRSVTRPSAPVLSLRRYGSDLLSIFYGAMDREFLKGGRWKDTITVHCGSISPLTFSLSATEKEFLFEQGYHQVAKYLRYKGGF